MIRYAQRWLLFKIDTQRYSLLFDQEEFPVLCRMVNLTLTLLGSPNKPRDYNLVHSLFQKKVRRWNGVAFSAACRLRPVDNKRQLETRLLPFNQKEWSSVAGQPQ